MNIARALRQMRRSVGLAPMGISDLALPIVGVFTFGALAGACVALLFAPMTGKRLREQILDYRAQRLLGGGDSQANAQRSNATRNAPEPYPRG
jgi:hypothetical protein